ncbi:MAG: hypothetical protein JXN59_10110 [Anaerolineae bacterium]|nr:hypothetical protein [Anaerolineae bacterium]
MSVLKPVDLELLSAYLDDALAPPERAALERRLAAEPALRAELEALQAVVTRVRALPTLAAPRDFRLDPAVYGQATQRKATPRRMTASRVYYRWGSALSALAAAIMLVIGLLGVLEPRFLGAPLAAPDALLQQAAQEEEGTAQRELQEPPQIAAMPTPSPAGSPIPMLAVTAIPLDEAARGTGPAGTGGGFGGEAKPLPTAFPPDVEDSMENFAAEMPAEAEESLMLPPGAPRGMGGGGMDTTGDPTGDELPPPAAFSAESGAAASGLADDAAFAAGAAAADSGPAAAPSHKSPLPTATLPVTEVALLPTPTLAEVAEGIPPVPLPDDGAWVEAPRLRIDPGIFLGASLALLVLAVVFFALSRRK